MDVSRERLVRIFGISPRAINDLGSRGILVKSGHDCYDLDLSVIAYTSHLREIASGRGGEAAGQNLTAERAKLAAIQAEEKSLKVAKAKGELVPADAVAREWIAILQRVRAALLAVPARAQQRLNLTTKDVSELDLEIRAVLTEIGTDGQPAQ